VGVTHWKLVLSYDGSSFHGWQVQPGLSTVQGVLASAVESITGERVLPQGSGRTDAGVHALAQVASLSLHVPIPSENLQRALNRLLPSAIRVTSTEEVSANFHARHSAQRKSYEYRIFERKLESRREPSTAGGTAPAPERICSPFLAPYVWDNRWQLDFDRLQAGAALLLGAHDFTSFAASDPELAARDAQAAGVTGRPNPVKTIFRSEWTIENSLLLYRVTGSGFLHHMVRTIVGTLVEVARGSLDPGDITTILEARNRAAAGPTAPARGLYLHSVEYPAGFAAQPSRDGIPGRSR